MRQGVRAELIEPGRSVQDSHLLQRQIEPVEGGPVAAAPAAAAAPPRHGTSTGVARAAHNLLLARTKCLRHLRLASRAQDRAQCTLLVQPVARAAVDGDRAQPRTAQLVAEAHDEADPVVAGERRPRDEPSDRARGIERLISHCGVGGRRVGDIHGWVAQAAPHSGARHVRGRRVRLLRELAVEAIDQVPVLAAREPPDARAQGAKAQLAQQPGRQCVPRQPEFRQEPHRLLRLASGHQLFHQRDGAGLARSAQSGGGVQLIGTDRCAKHLTHIEARMQPKLHNQKGHLVAVAS